VSRVPLPVLVAVKIVPLLTELLQVKPEAPTEHNPFELVSVNPEPEVVAVKDAQVCTLHVPYDKRQPVVLPLDVRAVIVDFGGGVVPVPVGCEVVVVGDPAVVDFAVEVLAGKVVGAGPPDVLVRYDRPELPQEPADGALIGIRVPSTSEPWRW